MHPRAVRARQARPGAEHVAVMGGAYHGHTRVLIDMSPFKFEGAGGEGRQAWVHVLPCPDPYRRAPLPKRQTRRRRVCCHTSAPSSWCGVKPVHKRITHCWQHCCGHLPPDPFMLSPLAPCWVAAAAREQKPRPCRIRQALPQRRLAHSGCSDARPVVTLAPRPAGACTWTAARRPRRRSPRPRRPAGASAPSSPSPSCPAAGRRARACFLAAFPGRPATCCPADCDRAAVSDAMLLECSRDLVRRIQGRVSMRMASLLTGALQRTAPDKLAHLDETASEAMAPHRALRA